MVKKRGIYGQPSEYMYRKKSLPDTPQTHKYILLEKTIDTPTEEIRVRQPYQLV
jgi:hypothetical protein